MANTFATYLSSGTTPGVEFLLVVEGSEYIFASSPASEQVLADGRTIVRGLRREGLGIDESVDIAGAGIDIPMPSVQIDETAGTYRDAGTRAFAAFGAPALTWLRSAVAVGDTTIEVMSTSGLGVNDFVHVGTETWKVASIVDSDTITVTRAQWGTTAQAFAVSTPTTSGVDIDLVPIFAEPPTLAGRRCWLYGRGLDDLTSATVDAGTTLWRGVVDADPEESKGVWTLAIKSRMSLFDAKIGRESDATTMLRGAYYPDTCPIWLQINRRSGAADTSAHAAVEIVTHSGHAETQESFCEALQSTLETFRVGEGWTGAFSVRPTSDAETSISSRRYGWDLYYTPDTATPVWLSLTGGSPIDGWFTGQWSDDREDGAIGFAHTFVGGVEYRAHWNTDARADGAGGSISLPVEDLRRIPRACYEPRFGSIATVTYPLARFYLDRTAGYVTSASLLLTPPHVGEGDAPDPIEVPVANFGVEGYVEAASTFDLPPFSAGGETQPTISMSIRYGSSLGCHLAAFMDALLVESPLSCNQGVTPWLTNDDVESWTTAVVEAANGRPWLLYRDYVFSKPVKLIDVLRHEWRLYGLFPYLSENGKIALRSSTMEVDTPSVSLAETRHAPSEGDFGTLKITPDGIIGEVIYKTGYNAAEDKHEGAEYPFKGRGIAAQAKGKTVPLEIAPKVNPKSGTAVTVDDVASQAASILHLYGQRRYVVTVPVTMHLHSLRCGDGALLTLPQLPYFGARGATTPGSGFFQTRGTVIGRRWPYGDEPRGYLTFLVHSLNIAGYAPTCRVSSAAGSLRTWTLTMAAAQYGPGGAVADASFFAAGYKVILRQFDKTQPQRITGTVSSVSGNDVAVTLNSDWPGVGSSTWDLGFGAAGSGITAAQKLYVYIAATSGRISYDSGGRVAHNLA